MILFYFILRRLRQLAAHTEPFIWDYLITFLIRTCIKLGKGRKKTKAKLGLTCHSRQENSGHWSIRIEDGHGMNAGWTLLGLV